MALNFSHLAEDSLVSPMKKADGYVVENTPERNGDGFSKSRHPNNREVDGRGSQETVSRDIDDVLPADPFDMDMGHMEITSLRYLEVNCLEYGAYEFNSGDGNHQRFPGLDFTLMENAMRILHALPGNTTGFNLSMNVPVAFGAAGSYRENCVMGHGLELGCPACEIDNFLSSNAMMGLRNLESDSQSRGFGGLPPEEMHDLASIISVDDILCFKNDEMDIAACRQSEVVEDSGTCNGEAGMPHPAIDFALRCLGVRDLLVVERVCSYLHSTIQRDPLLWRSIHIDSQSPLHDKITDDVLLQLTNRAQGKLQCLSLENCTKITDDGLKRVLDNNPRLMKLGVPGCSKLSIEGVVKNLKAFKSLGTQEVKHLRIAGLFGLTNTHLEELNLLLGLDSGMPKHTHKPHFFRGVNSYLSLEDDRAIDIEICPRCQNLRRVYDCPTKSCQGQEHDTRVCRACTICIARCFYCGRCVDDNEYEEMFCLESVCSDCLKQHSKCQEGQDSDLSPLKPAVLHEPNGMEIHHD